MAKKYELKERETNEVIYPITSSECIVTNDDSGVATKAETRRFIEEELNAAPGQLEVLNNIKERLSNDTDLATSITKEIAEAKKQVFIDLWNQACSNTIYFDGKNQKVGKYNEATGYFELNGLTDITYEEALCIYNEGRFNLWDKGLYAYTNIRTNIPHLCWANGNTVNLNNLASSTKKLAVFVFPTTGVFTFYCENAFYSFSDCPKLKKILGLWQVRNTVDMGNAFRNCTELEYIEGLRFASDTTIFSLRYCNKLNLQTFQNIVKNAANTKTCVVTIHPDVYAKLTDEGNAEWNQVLQEAQSKNIQFVTT